jgi:hypothetical protein
MHAIVFGLAPLAASSAADPFSVICHSEAPDAAAIDQAPAHPNSAPSQACDHCTFCHAPAALAPPDVALGYRFAPALQLSLTPTSSDVRDSRTVSPKLARGPPQFV